MNPLNRTARLLAIVVPLGALVGCDAGQATPPPLTPAEGVVTVNGQPLPGAEVRFIPTLEGLGSEMIATGVTDEQGRFTLKTGTQPGAAVCIHKVMVVEASAEGEGDDRRDSDESQRREIERSKGLKNRPIPTPYTNLAQTPLEITVSADRADYPLQLKR